MAKTKKKKKLEMRQKSVESFQQMMSNIDCGKTNFYIDKKYEIFVTGVNDEGLWEFIADVPESLRELFDNFYDMDYSEDGLVEYEAETEDFEKVFTGLINTQRLTA